MPLPARTDGVPLERWFSRGRPQSWAQEWGQGGLHAEPDHLYDAGVAATDLAAFAQWEMARWGGLADPQAAAGLVRTLLCLRHLAPVLSLRAGVGWALIGATIRGTAHINAVEFCEPWQRRGLAETGWLFQSAGLTRNETATMVADAQVPEDALRAMAVLRGTPVPHE